MSELPEPAATRSGPSRRRVWIQRVLVVASWVAIFAAWRLYVASTGASETESAQDFVDAVDTAWWGIAAYVAVYLVRPLVLFPALLLTIAGGLLFGPVLGVVVVVVAANASAMVAWGVGRLLGHAPEIEADEAQSLAKRWAGRLRARSFETVLVMRLVLLPYDLVSYLAGVLHVRWQPFLAATAIGSIPTTVSYVLLGASIDRVDEGVGGLDTTTLAVAGALFVVSLALAWILRHRMPAPPAEQGAADG